MFLQVIQSFENIISKTLNHVIVGGFFGEIWNHSDVVLPKKNTPPPSPHSFPHVEHRLSSARNVIRNHSVFSLIRGIDDLRTFMKFHAFSVWQHLHLLEAFQAVLRQRQRTAPLAGAAIGLRLVNEMLLEKETEVTAESSVSSHFDLYLEAMRHLDISATYIAQLEQLHHFSSDHQALRKISLPKSIQACLDTHLHVLESGSLFKIGGFLFLGRESGCGKSFISTVEALEELYPEKMAPLVRYLNFYRATAAQKKQHMSRKFFEGICGVESDKWLCVTQAAELALHSRVLLWDGACEEILKREISQEFVAGS